MRRGFRAAVRATFLVAHTLVGWLIRGVILQKFPEDEEDKIEQGNEK